MSDSYTEDYLVEQPAFQLMQHELVWDVVNCYDERSGGASNLGRDGKREVVLVSRLRPALQRLNPDLPVEAIEGAVEEICRDFFVTALLGVEADLEIDKLLSGASKPEPGRFSHVRSHGWISVFLAFSPMGETGLFSETTLDFHRVRSFTNA